MTRPSTESKPSLNQIHKVDDVTADACVAEMCAFSTPAISKYANQKWNEEIAGISQDGKKTNMIDCVRWTCDTGKDENKRQLSKMLHCLPRFRLKSSRLDWIENDKWQLHWTESICLSKTFMFFIFSIISFSHRHFPGNYPTTCWTHICICWQRKLLTAQILRMASGRWSVRSWTLLKIHSGSSWPVFPRKTFEIQRSKYIYTFGTANATRHSWHRCTDACAMLTSVAMECVSFIASIFVNWCRVSVQFIFQ